MAGIDDDDGKPGVGGSLAVAAPKRGLDARRPVLERRRLERRRRRRGHVDDQPCRLRAYRIKHEGVDDLHRPGEIEHDAAFPGSDQPVTVVADEATALARLDLAEVDVRHVDHEPIGIGQPEKAVFRVLLEVDDEARARRIANDSHVADEIGRRAAGKPGHGGNKSGGGYEAQRKTHRQDESSSTPPSPESASLTRLYGFDCE